MSGSTEDFIQRHIYYFGVWEPELTRFVASRLLPGRVFIDVGANIGYFTLLASTRVGNSGSVVAIEASPTIFDQLKRHLALNAAANVRAVNVGVSDRDGRARLYLGPKDNRGGTTLFQRSTAGSELEVEVATAPLGKILTTEEWSRARILKIDVEGAEALVAEGLRPLLASAPDDLEIVMEVSPLRLAQQGRSVESVLEIFRDAGFCTYRLHNDYTADIYLDARLMRLPERFDGGLSEPTDVVFSKI
jgi:FkbM family methyltransferase